MKKILAFAASNSQQSINKKLAYFAASSIKNTDLTLLDLNDFEMPIYGIDREKQKGIPELAHKMKEHIRSADGIIISFAEHNGSYAVVFKNILDWISRIERSTFLGKPMFLLATSPGGRGAAGVLSHASSRFPFMDGKVSATFSLPFFSKNFSEETGITDETLRIEFQEQLNSFLKAIETNLMVEA